MPHASLSFRLHRLVPLLLAVASSVVATPPAHAQADTTFDPSIARPRFAGNGPRVLIDETHANAFTLRNGRGRALPSLLTADGYRVSSSGGPLTRAVLRDVDVLVIAAAQGAGPGDIQANGGPLPDSARQRPAFTADEIATVDAWIRDGGALFLLTEHWPFGRSMSGLARPLGIDIRDGYLADTAHLARFAQRDSIVAGSQMESIVVISRANGLLSSHPITDGQHPTERVERVVVGGTSLCGPDGASTLFRVARSAEQRIAEGTPGADPRLGCAQGIAFAHGRGRVVALADANWFVTAQIRDYGSKRVRLGLSMTDAQNRQLTLNAVHWLSQALH
jgi:hypothetical protein